MKLLIQVINDMDLEQLRTITAQQQLDDIEVEEDTVENEGTELEKEEESDKEDLGVVEAEAEDKVSDYKYTESEREEGRDKRSLKDTELGKEEESDKEDLGIAKAEEKESNYSYSDTEYDSLLDVLKISRVDQDGIRVSLEEGFFDKLDLLLVIFKDNKEINQKLTDLNNRVKALRGLYSHISTVPIISRNNPYGSMDRIFDPLKSEDVPEIKSIASDEICRIVENFSKETNDLVNDKRYDLIYKTENLIRLWSRYKIRLDKEITKFLYPLLNLIDSCLQNRIKEGIKFSEYTPCAT